MAARKRPRRQGWLTGLSLLFCLMPSSLTAQGLQRLVDRCGEGMGGFTGRCHVAALALDAARGGVATAAALGGEVPGSASTVGYRLRSSPRISLSARAGVTRFSIPNLLEDYAVPTEDRQLMIPSLQLSGVMGVFNGFSPKPTVGGVFSLDLTASAHHLFTRKDDGFQSGLSGWGVGARMGILRESFTLPGITVSLARRWVDDARLGAEGPLRPARMEFDARVTSLRGMVGKDLFGTGFFGGAGWDRISGDASVGLRMAPSAPETLTTQKGIDSERMTFFAGASRTFLIVQLSGAAGFSRSLDPELPVDPGGNEYPSARAFYGSVSLRVTF